MPHSAAQRARLSRTYGNPKPTLTNPKLCPFHLQVRSHPPCVRVVGRERLGVLGVRVPVPRRAECLVGGGLGAGGGGSIAHAGRNIDLIRRHTGVRLEAMALR